MNTHLTDLSERAGTPDNAAAFAFDAMPMPALIVTWTGDIVGTNRAARTDKIWSLSKGPNVQTSLHEIFEITAKQQPEMLRTAVAAGRIALFARSGDRKRAIPVEFHVGLIKSSHQRQGHILMARNKLRERVEAIETANLQHRLVRSQLEMVEADRDHLTHSLHSMEVFAGAASHDLRNPIGVLQGLTDHLQNRCSDDELPKDIQETLAVMSRTIGLMGTLTTKLLQHAKSSTGAFDPAPCELDAHIEQVCSDLAVRIEEVGATVHVSGGPAEVVADGVLLDVLLTNLIENALKYRHPDRAPEIVIDLSPSTLIISDNGIGFSPTNSDLMFQAFERLGRTNEASGHGLGLATCVEICRRHGWRISAAGEEGKGAVFTVDFQKT